MSSKAASGDPTTIDQIIEALNSDKSIPDSLKTEISQDLRYKVSVVADLRGKNQELRQQVLGESDESTQKHMDYSSMDKQVLRHIQQLKIYNDLRDTAMKILAIMADQKKTDITAVAKELQVDTTDE
ncbi:hypothetical protein DASC09_046780 [Saccharomycopsis crataegensis]|uniref:Uncharacterized protein n=1 Tax=Saccharomycopsis crataegensis TaxID=43959 RepID=A0AAV5QR00_9ASCO|nr:hypothetical protein DASC09_046780 [Saccharomycopsis crataegensis]